jgi:UDP-glucose 4-epimerase
MILVTGGLGFIGAHTARAIVDLGEDCVVTQYRVARNPDFIAADIGKHIFVEQLDATDVDSFGAIAKKHNVTGIVHLSGTGSTPHDAFDDVTANNAGLLNALRVARDLGFRVSQASSVGVYAGLRDVPLTEDLHVPLTAGHPIEAYKKSAEIITSYVSAREGIDSVNLRISGIYGPGYRSMNNMPSRFVHAAVNGEPVDLSRGAVFALDGGDLCDARDCGRAIALLQVAGSLEHRTYNVGAGRATTNGDLKSAVQHVVPEFDVELSEGFNPKGPGAASYLDIGRIHADTGYSPAHTLEESMTHYVEWLRAGHEN